MRSRFGVGVLVLAALLAAAIPAFPAPPDAAPAPPVDTTTGPEFAPAMPPHADFDVARRLAFGPPDIRGIADGEMGKLYVGFSNVFTVLSVTDRTKPIVLGTLELGVPITGVVVSSSNPRYVYATAGPTLYVVDVANPSAPSLVATLALPRFAYHAAQNGIYLYVVGSNGVMTVNVSDITAPTVSADLALSGTGRKILVAPAGNYAYVANSYGIVTLTLANPALPSVSSTVLLSNNYALAFRSTTHLVAVDLFGRRVLTYSLANPALPVLAGSLGNLGFTTDVEVHGDIAYVTKLDSGLHVVSLANPAAPTLLGTASLRGSIGGVVCYANSAAFVASTTEGLKVVDVSNPSAPSQVGRLLAARTRDVAVSGNYAYLATDTSMVLVVDLAGGRVVNMFPTVSNTNAVAVAGSVLYVAETNRLEILDISDAPAIYRFAELPLDGPVQAIALRNNLLYLDTGGAGTLNVVDVTDPTRPAIVRGLAHGKSPASAAQVAGEHLYVARNSYGVELYSLRDPAAPASAWTQWLGNATAVSVDGDRALLLDNEWGLHVFDVRNPAAPVQAGFWYNFDAKDAVGRGDLAYAVTRDGLVVLDVHEPQAPVERAFYPAKSMTKVRFWNGHALLLGDGLAQLHFAGQCWDDHEPNADFGSAKPIVLGAAYNGRICDAADQDWFTFTADATGTARFTLDVPVGHQFRVEVRDRHGELVGVSTADGAREAITFGTVEGSAYIVTVIGAAGDYDAAHLYRLSSTFTACAAPTQPVYLRTVTRDVNANAVLEILDPNQPATVTGYDVWRSAQPNAGFALRAQNVVDMDQGVANTQWVDTASTGSVWYYNVKAYSSACGTEGP